jgi:hypothetical protein
LRGLPSWRTDVDEEAEMRTRQAARRVEKVRPATGPRNREAGIQLTFYPRLAESAAPAGQVGEDQAELLEERMDRLPGELIGMYYMG